MTETRHNVNPLCSRYPVSFERILVTTHAAKTPVFPRAKPCFGFYQKYVGRLCKKCVYSLDKQLEKIIAVENMAR